MIHGSIGRRDREERKGKEKGKRERRREGRKGVLKNEFKIQKIHQKRLFSFFLPLQKKREKGGEEIGKGRKAKQGRFQRKRDLENFEKPSQFFFGSPIDGLSFFNKKKKKSIQCRSQG